MNADIIKSIEEIKASLKDDNSEHKDWNLNYFNNQKGRYLSDLYFYSSLKGVKNVLEVGAAPFHLSLSLQSLGYDLKVIDIAPSRFQWFIDRHKLDVEQCDIEIDTINARDGYYDLIIFTEVFEHLRINPIETLKKLREKLKPGGLLYLTTPNFFRYTNTINFFLRRPVVNAYYEFKKLEDIGHMGHVREYSKKEVELFLENTGYEIVTFSYKQHKKERFKKKVARFGTSLIPSTKSYMEFLAKSK